MRNFLHKTVDAICIILELVFTIISLPFKIVKAILDMAA